MHSTPRRTIATLLIRLSASSCLVLIVACSSQPSVQQFGAMKAVMREGQTQPRIALADAASKPGAIAVGAIEGLNGEVTIVDSQVFVAQPKETGLVLSGPAPQPTGSATLLTLSHVEAWQEILTPHSASGTDLDEMIAQLAAANGLDVNKPFPIQIIGTADSINIHVVNGYCPHGVDPASQVAQPWHFDSTAPTQVRIVGFFAPNAGGVMTHHGSDTHLHALFTRDGELVTGHIDAVTVAKGAMLRLPK